MARTFREIENSIIEGLTARNVTLSNSKVAEWRVWTATIAGVIYSFESLLDVFRREVESHSNIIRVGTADWYATMVRRYQHGHTLLCDKETYNVYYAMSDEKAKIVKQVAVKELESYLLIKIAGHDTDGKVVPLSLSEAKGVRSYVEHIKFVGTAINIISQSADTVRYSLTVYCRNEADPTEVSNNVMKGLDLFKSSLEFDAKLYSNKLLTAVMNVQDVVTAELFSIERKSYINEAYTPVGIVDTMDAGYFEYADDSTLIVKRLNDMTDEN